MSEYRPALEHVRRGVPMPEPAMERLLRRRDRKRRNQRIAAVVVGLAVAAIGIGGVGVALRAGSTTRPASGPTETPPATGGGGWVGFILPTVAI